MVMFSRLLPISHKKKRYLNKILIVTGASSSVGCEIASLFANHDHGATIVGININLAAIEKTVEAVLAAVNHKQAEIPVDIESTGMKILSRVSPSLVRYLARFAPTPH